MPEPATESPSPSLTDQARDLPLDSHIHTRFSPDSSVAIDDYASQAVERGIAEIAITDHVDFDPAAPAYDYVPFADRERTVRDAAERWAKNGVAIRFGVEITYDSRFEEVIRDHLGRNAYDFVIGSVHVYADSPFHISRVAGWVAGKPLADVVAPYFGEVERAIRSGLFDTVGHLDFVKRYLHPHVTAAMLAEAPELYEPLLAALVETGTALEVNTSGLRQASRETYPSAEIVARYQVLGGTRLSAGSDAHTLETFTSGLAEGYRVAAAAGFADLTFRRGGAPVAVTVPDRFVKPGET
jgi:histidinol-phosphatase (PHP family)